MEANGASGFLPGEIWRVVSGVVLAIVTGGVLYLLRSLLSQLVGIATRAFTSSIRGTWRTTFIKQGEKVTERAWVYQFLHWVWGTIYFDAKDRNYKFKGTIRSDILVATYEIAKRGRSRVDRGAFTLALNLSEKPPELKGKYCWTDDDSRIPEGDEYTWTKED